MNRILLLSMAWPVFAIVAMAAGSHSVAFAAQALPAGACANNKVTITGGVSKPGEYPAVAGETLSGLLKRAGGPALNADLRIELRWKAISGPARQLRASSVTVRPPRFGDGSCMSTDRTMRNVYDLRNPEDFRLEPGDEIFVYKSSPYTVGTVTRYFNDVPFTDAVASILKNTGYGYSIDPSISTQNLKVTAALKNAPVEGALIKIAQAAGAQCRISNGVVTIAPQQKAFTPVVGDRALLGSAAMGTGLAVSPARGASSEVTKGSVATAPASSETIDLNYVEAGDVLPLVTQVEGVQAARASGQSRIVVTAPSPVLERARQAISDVDTPDARPRPVRIEMAATVDLAGEKYVCVAETTTSDGVQAPVNLTTSDIDLGEGRRGELQLDAVVTPTVLRFPADGRDVSLTGSGVISGAVPARFRQQFTFSVPVQSGTPIWADSSSPLLFKNRAVLASGRLNAGDTKLGYEITAGVGISSEATALYAAPPPKQQYDVNLALKKAELLVKEGKLNEALSKLLEARRAVPKCAEVHNHMGNVLMKMGKFDEAAQSYRKAVELDPDVPAYKANLEEAQTRTKE